VDVTGHADGRPFGIFGLVNQSGSNANDNINFWIGISFPIQLYVIPIVKKARCSKTITKYYVEQLSSRYRFYFCGSSPIRNQRKTVRYIIRA
jgi:hypothetical protein